jgi:pimeloyl-ACP methyl ester carboxylesterase
MKSFTASDGVRLAYFDDQFTRPWQPAPVLVMLHSAIGHSGRFFAMVPPLLPHFRVVRMDLRGHGQSEVPNPESVLDMARLVEDVRELLAEIDCRSAHFIGNSAGGYIAQNLALTYPDAVRSMALFAAPPGLKQSNANSWIPRIQKEGLRNFLKSTIADRLDLDAVDPDLVEWFLDEAARNDTAFIGRFVAYMASQDWGDRVKDIACPTLVVIPGAETVGGLENYDIMKRTMPDVETLVYDGMPHNICDGVPERCAADALAFFRSRFPKDFD